MLVLSRRRGEEVWIGEEIRLSVVQVRGSRVKLMIDAPGKVRIRRGELAPLAGDDNLTDEAAQREPANIL